MRARVLSFLTDSFARILLGMCLMTFDPSFTIIRTCVTRSSDKMRPVQWPHSEKIAFAPQRSIFYGHDRLKVMLPSARARLDADADCTHLTVWGQQRQICTDIAFGIAFGESKSCCLILDRAFECCQMAKYYTYLPWHWDNSVVIICCSYFNY